MIVVQVNRNFLTVRASELLTSGSCRVNEIKFVFSPDWDELTKTAVFKTTKKQISVILTKDDCIVPWEVLTDAGESLWVGVYGTRGETIILPTIWGNLGRVLNGAEPGEDAKEPTPDVYAQVLSSLNNKIDEPNIAGVAGQVLGLDENLKPQWINQTGGGGGEINIDYDPESGDLSITTIGSGSVVDYDETTGDLTIR